MLAPKICNGQTLGEALDAPHLQWSSSGWAAQSDLTHDGSLAAQSSGFMATLQASVTGVTAVSFWWKASCCELSKGLHFYINGVLQARISGEIDWQSRTFYLPAGANTLKWVVDSSCSGSESASTGWLDQISFSTPEPVQIIKSPASQTVDAGTTATLAPEVTGAEPWAIQWFQNGNALPSATNLSLIISNAQTWHAGEYNLIISSPMSLVTSETAVLAISPALPQFTRQPSPQTDVLGTNVTFTVAAKGSDPIHWQWFRNEVLLPEATNTSLTVFNPQMPDAGNYTVVASNVYGSVTSQVASLSFLLEPVFKLQPHSAAGPNGATVSIPARAQGSGVLAWQWYFNGEPVPGATSNTLQVVDCKPAVHGQYWAVVTNEFGARTSSVATLSYSPVAIWGNVSEVMAAAAPEATNVLTLTGGDWHATVLRSDGTVAVWGSPRVVGSDPLIPGATNIVSIAAGSTHVAAAREDGQVVQQGLIMGSIASLSDLVPPEATNVVALGLGSGARHVMGIRRDGTVIDYRDDNVALTDLVPASATNVVAVAAGAFHSLALRGDGTLVAWGHWTSKATPIPSEATNIIAIAAGWHHSLALRRDGKVLAWGVSSDDRTSVPAAATNVVAISAGGFHNLALRRDGKIIAWGRKDSGRTMVPAWVTNVVAIACTGGGSMALLADGPAQISAQPLSRTAVAGDVIDISAGVVGAFPLSCQWYNGSPIPGATNAHLTFTNVQAENPHFWLVVSNHLGVSTSRVATVTVTPSPLRAIVVPEFVLATNGVAQVTAWAMGSSPTSYQWHFHGTNLLNDARIQGADSATLTINGFATTDNGGYWIVASNAYGSLTSSIVTIHGFANVTNALAEAIDLPTASFLRFVGSSAITGFTNYWFYQSAVTSDGVDAAQSPALARGHNAGFGMVMDGPGAVFFHWKASTKYRDNVLGFTLNSVYQASIAEEVPWQRRSFALKPGPNYLQWVYTRSISSSESEPNMAWVDQVSFGPAEAPLILIQPTTIVTNVGKPIRLSASVTGTEPLTYRWFRNGTEVISTTLSPWISATAGAYSLVVTNAAGITTSEPIILVVLPENETSHPWLTRDEHNSMQVNWSVGTLETAESLSGPWVEQPAATSPYTLPMDGASQFCRIRLK